MPWKETCPMDEKVRFIAACSEEPNLAEVCRRFGISRKTGYKWLARYEALGIDGLRERPPLAFEPPGRLDTARELAIVELRKEHPLWGPKKLRALLQQSRPEQAWPAASTFGEVLKRNGLIRPRRRRVRMPPSSAPLGDCAGPNDVWCIDFKGQFGLGDGVRCYPLTLSDGASRYLLKCEGLTEPRTEGVRRHLELAFREYGLPDRIRSDNGPPFAALRAGGLSELSIWWIKLGIVPERIEPGHPEQNGRHERMHRTLKAEVASPPRANLLEQQRAFDHFRHVYNELRPHEALEQVAPARRYEPSRRSYPASLVTPEYRDCVVRWTSHGLISWNAHAVRVGPSSFHKEAVGLKQISESTWHVYFGPVLLGALDDRDTEPVLRTAAPIEPDDGQPDQASVTANPDSEMVTPDSASMTTGRRHPAGRSTPETCRSKSKSQPESVT